ncbi:hypothetical protein CEXT_442981 [Caerostris extrusa]|uniref:Uncharacterized protein n=1 Tax=Caerostris extrusa TaxID=172846 RepID=A0AAV4NS16_CAEEX|nr:hypothetical protein CEXT_442981 [Caerostris extrusa]
MLPTAVSKVCLRAFVTSGKPVSNSDTVEFTISEEHFRPHYSEDRTRTKDSSRFFVRCGSNIKNRSLHSKLRRLLCMRTLYRMAETFSQMLLLRTCSESSLEEQLQKFDPNPEHHKNNWSVNGILQDRITGM